jgi:myxalamid-type polyketide synthase MxaE and MxaD
MGRQLLQWEAFRTAVKAVDVHLYPLLGWSVVEGLTGALFGRDPDRAEVAQPLIFALQVGLTALWRSLGVEAQAVVGHSLGEIAAAHTAGVLTLSDA